MFLIFAVCCYQLDNITAVNTSLKSLIDNTSVATCCLLMVFWSHRVYFSSRVVRWFVQFHSIKSLIIQA